jgi:hypothetical protein
VCCLCNYTDRREIYLFERARHLMALGYECTQLFDIDADIVPSPKSSLGKQSGAQPNMVNQ